MKNTGFNERYLRWKNGEQVYLAGRIKPLNVLKYAPWSLEQWKDDIQQYKGINTDDKSYDYDRFFKENPKAAWGILNDRPDAHFTDGYKGSFHPSASDGSFFGGSLPEITVTRNKKLSVPKPQWRNEN